MAIFTPSPIVSSLSGNLGSLTFKLTRRGPIVASRILGRQYKSTPQHTADSHWTSLTSAWHSLDLEQHDAWRAFARNISNTNRLGIPIRRNGFQQFMSHNTPAQIAGLSLILDPPKFGPLQPPIDVCVDFNNAAYYEYYSTFQAPVTPLYQITEGSRPYRFLPGIPDGEPVKIPTWHFKRWRTLSIEVVHNGTPYVVLNGDWTSVLGLCQNEEEVAIRTSLWDPTALRSLRVIATAVVYTHA